jgi:hypothetical protein
MVGRAPSNDASLNHMAVSVWMGPVERYSAIPSANQSGGLIAMSVESPAPARPRDQVSY